MHVCKKVIQGICLFFLEVGQSTNSTPLLQLHNLADSHSKSGFVKFENSIF